MQVDVITNRNIKPFFEATMKSNPERITGNSTMDLGTLVTMNNPNERKLLNIFLAILVVTQEILSTEWDLPKQSAITSRQAVLYGIIFISRGN